MIISLPEFINDKDISPDFRTDPVEWDVRHIMLLLFSDGYIKRPQLRVQTLHQMTLSILSSPPYLRQQNGQNFKHYTTERRKNRGNLRAKWHRSNNKTDCDIKMFTHVPKLSQYQNVPWQTKFLVQFIVCFDFEEKQNSLKNILNFYSTDNSTAEYFQFKPEK